MVIAKRLSDGSTSVINRRNGVRYVITSEQRDGKASLYAEGQFLQRGIRADLIAALDDLCH